MNPKFSIIIPVYNVAPYLRECLDSVLVQTYTSWEVICVDDGSTDGSDAILDDYAARDPRIKVFHKTNGGVASARNFGIEKSIGEWLWFVDADDAIHSRSLELIALAINNNPNVSQVTFGDVTSESVDINAFLSSQPCKSYCLGDPQNVESVIYKCIRRAGWAVVHKRSAVRDIRYGDYRIGEDILFNLNVFWRSSRMVVALSAKIYYYRERLGSAVHRAPKLRDVEDWIKTEICCSNLLLENRQYWNTQGLGKYLAGITENAWFSFCEMLWHISNGDRTRVLPKWLELQALNMHLYKFPKGRCIQYFVIRALPFGIVALWLIRPKMAIKQLLRKPLYPLVVLTRPLRHRK